MKNVDITITSDPTKVLKGITREQYIQVSLEAKEPTDLEHKRQKLNIAFVIDRSGSMEGEKLFYVLEAVEEFITNLSTDDIISVVAFDNRIETILEPTVLGLDKKILLKYIKQLYASGSTNLCEGVMQGLEEVYKNYNKNYTNRVILFSDGLANEGITDLESIKKQIIDYIGSSYISLTTLGVGKDFSEELLRELAISAKGNYYYIEDPTYIQTIVARELTGLKTLLWKNVEIEFKGSEGVEIIDLYGYTVQGNKSFIGELRALDELYVIARIRLGRELVKNPKVKAVLRYDDVYNQEYFMEKEEIITIKSTTNKTKVKENIVIKTNVELFLLGSYIEKASALMKAGEFDEAVDIISDRKDALEILKHKNSNDERIGLKVKFLEKMIETAMKRSYNSKFAKMSSYYSYSAERQNYRKKIAKRHRLTQ